MVKKFARIALLLGVVVLATACNVFSSGETINTSPGATTTLCPAVGMARAAIMPPLAEGSHASLVYTVADPNTEYGILRRYDTVTHHTEDIVNTPNANIIEAQISPDRQWILFALYVVSSHEHVELRLVRMDGQYQQTLFCLPVMPAILPSMSLYQSSIGNFVWSPNTTTVAVTGLTGKYQLPAIYILDIAQGQVQTELESSVGPIVKTPYGPSVQYTEVYSPVQWLDGAHLYLHASKMPGGIIDSPSAQQFLYLLDTNKGANQHNSDLQQVLSPQQMVSKNRQVCSFDSSSDGSQLFIVTCPSGGFNTTPPTSVTVQPAGGGTSSTILNSNTLAIISVHVASAGTLLLLVNDAATTSQNGIWKINTDGTGLTRLIAYDNPSFCGVSYGTCGSVSSDGSLYAMVQSSPTSGETLFYGSLNGGPLKQVATLNGLYAYFVGWTTV